MRSLALIVLAIGSMALPIGFANSDEPKPAAEKKSATKKADGDLAAIRESSQAFAAAFNKKDAKAIAALWTEDGDYTDDLGRKFVGRDAIAKGYGEFFSQNSGVKIRIVIDSLRLLSPNAAIEDGHALVDPVPAGQPGIGKYTAVHVKVDGKWLMSTVRDTHVDTASNYRHVADLEWLIGTWTSEDRGVKTESVCRWIANKSFVERTYTTTQLDGTATTGVQLIGWNAREGHVQSWNFNSDGGHAVGRWLPREGGWAAEIRGVTGDGAATTAVNLLTKLDDNAYVWQSTKRTLENRPLADSDEVVIKRRPSGK